MNSMQRILATVAGEPTDRSPFFVLLSLYASQWMGVDLKTYYHSADLLAAAQEKIVEKVGVDIITTQFSLGLEAEAFGATLRWYGNQPPNIIARSIQDFDALRKFRIPDMNGHPNLLRIRETVRRLNHRLGGEVPVIVPVMGPFELAAAMMGMDLVMEMVLYHPDLASDVLGKTGEFFVAWCNTLLADGAHIPLLVSSFNNADILSSAMVRTYTLPLFLKLLPQIKAPIIYHHGGGRLQPILQDLRSLPNLIGFYLDPSDNLLACRQIVGDMLLLGNLKGPALPAYTADEIYIACLQKLDEMRSHRRFLLATSQADVPLDTSMDRIMAIRHAVMAEGAQKGAS